MPNNATWIGATTRILLLAIATTALSAPSSRAVAADGKDRQPEAMRQSAQARDRQALVAVGGRRFAMMLPASCCVQRLGDRTRIVCPPHTRTPTTIRLELAGPASPTVPAEAKTLAFGAGRSLAYWITRYAGGSGGPEVYLIGRLRLGKTTLAVTCGSQGEFSRPPADWCVPYLRTMRPR
jgi:hypothetical protein